ncbi:Nucleoside-diphosphate-sugar epimerase [Lachnospiraceae bacterium NK3A20]|nr:Nucleoside-diphosphate-sugar epimerase [Lachnospiraceae bacterium NK3A20]
MVDKNVDLNHASILVTGSSGFIGSNLSKKLMTKFPGCTIVGIDNMNDYYDVRLKDWRVEELTQYPQFTFVKGDIADEALINELFAKYHFDVVVNLAAQAGVRYSIDHPETYMHSNVMGFYTILEACRHSYDENSGWDGVKHLVYASSSSVYGGNTKVPFSTEDQVDTPVSLYAATKKSNELMAHAYSKLYGIPATGLRFFSVYGPAGRPDMALFKFTDLFVEGKTIEVYNYGHCRRDFTYIDDIVEGVTRIMQHSPDENPVGAKYKVYNIGHAHPEELLDFITILEDELVKAGVLPEDYDFAAHTKYLPMQPGDVYENYADSSELVKDFGYDPSTTIRDGIHAFAAWYKTYMGK